MDAALLPLLAWLSPGYPVGAYAYSHGLEWAVEAGDVRDEASLAAWLADLIEHGAGRNDAILCAEAHRAAAAGDRGALVEANDLALALAPTAELRLETRQQGRSFLDATLNAWPHPRLADLAGALDGEVAYPVAVGLAAGSHGLPREAAVSAFAFAFMQNLVSAALRLGAVGQTDAQRVTARLLPAARALGAFAARSTPDDLGACALMSDLSAMRHETLYSRLFRS